MMTSEMSIISRAARKIIYCVVRYARARKPLVYIVCAFGSRCNIQLKGYGFGFVRRAAFADASLWNTTARTQKWNVTFKEYKFTMKYLHARAAPDNGDTATM